MIGLSLPALIFLSDVVFYDGKDVSVLQFYVPTPEIMLAEMKRNPEWGEYFKGCIPHLVAFDLAVQNQLDPDRWEERIKRLGGEA